MNIVLLGAPGAGKDTLADKLKDFYSFNILTTGALYRKEYEERTEFGILAHDYWGSGSLCPDEMTNELMKITYSKYNSDNLVFNGYPRSISQAKYLDDLCNVDLALLIDVSENVATDRLLKRKRVDDTVDVIKKRFKVYQENIEEVISYYKLENRLRLVDGKMSPDSVLTDAYKTILEMKIQ